MKKERVDVIDSNGTILRTVTRDDAHQKKLLHPVVRVFLFKKGEVYIQQRSLQKDIQPGKWEGSCSGHVDHGESEVKAIIREAKEELGVKLEEKELMQVDHILCEEPTHRTRIAIFIVANPNHKPSPKSKEVKQGKWVKVSWLTADVKKHPELYAPGFVKSWKLVTSK